MAEVELSGRAYAKMALHAARHPAAAVSGLLLGRPAPPPARCLCLADCVPLFRAAPVLRPMLDVALHQVEAWGATQGLLLAGYYQAGAGLDELSPPPLAQRVAGRLAELCEGAVLIMLNNRKFTMSPRVPPILVLEQRDRQWVPKDKNLVMWQDWESSRRVCQTLLEAKAYTQLVDFDAHLDDIRRDWTNQQLNAEIAQLMSVANGSA
ncbi:ER membrane protein complex subunit 9 isoform X1 [Alligator mississippiensis]|uniref:ER membrane protein complex subunit 9 isoform X1 n=1 Tax=Alligator mississippiensis TaxID=8496 RepID=UPI0003D0CEFE|nr:ER membrane protein complex subunit 9 isoform X1 [Alligator mississippiensis]